MNTSLVVLKNLENHPLIDAIFHYDGENVKPVLREIYALGFENDLLGGISNLILHDENVFSLTLAKKQEPSSFVQASYYDDISVIVFAVTAIENKQSYRLGDLNDLFLESNYSRLAAYYQANGTGDFIEHIAFNYQDEKLVAIERPSTTKLSDLKDYQEEKKTIIFNIENFLKGLPYHHTLLYGDRGTGKSSTVQAILNEYANQGLRLIQLDTSSVNCLPQVAALVQNCPLKFIIFIDDLTLLPQTAAFSALKAALEGAISQFSNCMVIVTSNRRHLVSESRLDRENEVHENDAIQDAVSLSDRFGLTVLFSATDKQHYLSIVSQIAEQYGISSPELHALAERWAVFRGGRTPRNAKQFCDYAYACIQRGVAIDF